MQRCNARTRNGNAGSPEEPGAWAGDGYCKRAAGWGTGHKGEGRCKSHGGASKGAPKGNKNAVKTGEHETFFAGSLTAEEEALWAGVDPDPLAQVDEQIRYCVLRLRRMQQRIEKLRGESLVITETATESGVAGDTAIDKTSEKREAALGVIQSIEDAITRVQGRHTRLVKLRHRVADTEQENEEMEELLRRVNKLHEAGDSYQPAEVG